MAHSFKHRVWQYLTWRAKKAYRSPQFKNSFVIISLCIGLAIIASFYQPYQSRYDKAPYPYYPIELRCDLDRIIDGDTVTVYCPKSLETDEKSLRSIRVWGMDAPETGQEYWGDFATQALKSLIGQESVLTIKIMSQDRYNRMIGKIFIKEEDIGLEMVRLGAAIVYHRYNNDKDYITAEKQAKIMRLGIWAVEGAQQNPEQWRRFNP